MPIYSIFIYYVNYKRRREEEPNRSKCFITVFTGLPTTNHRHDQCHRHDVKIRERQEASREQMHRIKDVQMHLDACEAAFLLLLSRESSAQLLDG